MTGRLSRASAISSLERSRSVTELLARKQNGRSASSRGVTNGPDPSQTLIDVTDAHRTLYSLLHRCLLSGSRHRHARIIGGDGAHASPYRPPQIVEPPEVDHRLHPSCARSGRPKTGRHRRFRSAGASARALPSAEFLFGRTRGWSDRRCGGCSCQARKAGIEGRELLYDDLRRRKLRLPSGYRRDCYRPARELITTAVNPELRDYDSL